MSIKIFDPITGQWIVQATNDAKEVHVTDVDGRYKSNNVEDCLREVAEQLTDTNVTVDIAKGQLTQVLNDFHEHITNHPGGSGGGGGGDRPTISSTFDKLICEKNEILSIPIFFNPTTPGNGTAYISINNVEVDRVNIVSGNNIINVGPLTELRNNISIYAKDSGGRLTDPLSWTVVCGGLEVSLEFDPTVDYSVDEPIIMPFRITTASDEPIIMHLTVGFETTQVTCRNGYNEYTFRGLGVGVHPVSLYLTSGPYKTPVQNFNIVVVNSQNLYVSTTFLGGEFEYGVPIQVNYRVSKFSTETFTVNLYVDDQLTKTLQLQAGSYYWTLSTLSIGTHSLKIEAIGVDGESAFTTVDVTIVQGEFAPIEPVTDGLLAWFDARERTNHDSDRTIWTDKTGNGAVGTLHGFNYYSNGWIDDALKFDGEAYVEIDMTPYKDNVKYGSTIDILYTARDVGIPEARILDYTGLDVPYKGIYVDTLDGVLTSLTNTGKVGLDTDIETRLTFVIDRQNKFAKIYVNGVLCRAFYLSDTGSGVNKVYEDFTHDQKIYLNSKKGESLFGACEIKNLRVYSRALSSDEVIQNHIADIKDLQQQKKLYDFNYNNTTTPKIYMSGNMEGMNGTISKEMRVKYVSPNSDLYGESFDLPYCQVKWQGTSSLTYVLKNYTIELKDENRADWYYTPYRNGIPEHIYCLKCDYMESTHAHNVGLAKFINDCLYDTKNPAQMLNSNYRNTVNGFPVLLYINNELTGVYNFNLDRFSTESLGYNKFSKCLSYEVSANSDSTAGAFVKWTPESGKSEIDYIASDFECRYPISRQNGNDNFSELKRLIDFVSDADDELFKEQFEKYFNKEYVLRYFLNVLVFGQVDNLGKNMMLTTFDGNIWYPQFYDLDTALGLDNTGFLKFDVDIEMEANVFNTSQSNLWVKVQRVFAADLKKEYELMRKDRYTVDNIMKYLYGEQISQIPEVNYNYDMQVKYLNYGPSYLYACHGNRYQHMKRWIRERLLYIDTLLDYTASTSDYITIRANKKGYVYLDLQTYSPMYLKVKWRDEANDTGTQTKKIKRGETIRFEYNIPTNTDQEILIYGGQYLKDIGDISNLKPTTMLIAKAPKLTRIICRDNPNLINTDLSNCTMLQEIDLSGCSELGGGIGASSTLDVSKCTNLKRVNIFGTKITAIYLNQSGGNLEEIYYPYTVQTVQIKNQPQLRNLGIPVYYVGTYGDSRNKFATNLVSVDIANCEKLESMVKNYYTNNGQEVPVPVFLGVSHGQTFSISNCLGQIERIDLSHCANLRSLSIADFMYLTEINFDDIARWDATSSSLETIKIDNCPNVETFTFNQNTKNGNNSLGVAFKTGTKLDLSELTHLKHIRSNVGIKGLKSLILPKSVVSLVFDYPEDTRYSQPFSDIENIWSVDANHSSDGFKGMDLLNMKTITDFSMGSLNLIERAENLDLKITNTFPYFNYHKDNNFFKPTGRIDISDYKDDLAYLFKGVDLDRLDVVCNKALPQTSARYMFAYTSGANTEKIDRLFGYLANVTDFSYMFYNAYIVNAPALPSRTLDCRYMFYNCSSMRSTPLNWERTYIETPLSDKCYTGCTGITNFGNEPGHLDYIPVSWGGYERQDLRYEGMQIEANNTLERPITYAMVKGNTMNNLATPTPRTLDLTDVVPFRDTTFENGRTVDSDIILGDGELHDIILKGNTAYVDEYDYCYNLSDGVRTMSNFKHATTSFISTSGRRQYFTINAPKSAMSCTIIESQQEDSYSVRVKGTTTGAGFVTYGSKYGGQNGAINGFSIKLNSSGRTTIRLRCNIIKHNPDSVPRMVLTPNLTANKGNYIVVDNESGNIDKTYVLESSATYVKLALFLYGSNGGVKGDVEYQNIQITVDEDEDTSKHLLNLPTGLQLAKGGLHNKQYDSFNLSTGEYTKRILIVKMKVKSEKVGLREQHSNRIVVSVGTNINNFEVLSDDYFDFNMILMNNNNPQVCDKFPNVTPGEPFGCFFSGLWGSLAFTFPPDYTLEMTKEFFDNNELTFYFELRNFERTKYDLNNVKLKVNPNSHISCLSHMSPVPPIVQYKTATKNYYPLMAISPEYDYTIYIESEKKGTVEFLGVNHEVLPKQVIRVNRNGKYDYNGKPYLKFKGDYGLGKVMVLQGDYTNKNVDYVDKMLSSVSPIIHISNGSNKDTMITLPKNITLRSLPDGTCDTLDLLTGTYTQNISSFVLNGTNEGEWGYNWGSHDYHGTQYYLYPHDTVGSIIGDIKANSYLFIEGFKTYSDRGALRGPYIAWTTTTGMCINLPTDVYSSTSGAEYLRRNPLTLYYQLAEPVVTQIDMEISNGVLRAWDHLTKVYAETTSGTCSPYFEMDLATTLGEILRQQKEQINTLKTRIVELETLNESLDEQCEELETEIVELKDKCSKLEDDNLTTMMAVVEVFETVLVMMPMRAMSLDNEEPTKGGSTMVEVYATLIIKGKKTLDDVPVVIRPQVEQTLRDLGAM